MENIPHPQKKVDTEWKEKADKQKAEAPKDEKFVPPEPDFNFFITTLAIQASIFLGIMENPASSKKEPDPAQAKFIIDTLGMLEQKTKGNLTEQEAALLEKLLFELRTAYIHITKNSGQQS